MNKKIKNFIISNKEKLLSKNFSLYLCCLSPENKEKYYEENLSKYICKKALVCEAFYGELDINKQKGLDKFIVNMILKNNEVKIQLNDIEKVKDFIKNIKSYTK